MLVDRGAVALSHVRACDVFQRTVDLPAELRPVREVDRDCDSYHDAGHGEPGGGAHAGPQRHDSASRSAYPTPRTFWIRSGAPRSASLRRRYPMYTRKAFEEGPKSYPHTRS